jgi:uncharacterized protein YbjQ (UPF0145 family)
MTITTFILTLLFPAMLIAFGFLIGSWREWRHIASLDQRERQYGAMVIRNTKKVPDAHTVVHSSLVMGEAVIATDYFKTFAASLRYIIGGEIKTYESLMRRARREATLRMLEQASETGATEVWNVRYETSNIRSATSGNRKAQSPSVEVLAFGTAVKRN